MSLFETNIILKSTLIGMLFSWYFFSVKAYFRFPLDKKCIPWFDRLALNTDLIGATKNSSLGSRLRVEFYSMALSRILLHGAQKSIDRLVSLIAALSGNPPLKIVNFRNYMI